MVSWVWVVKMVFSRYPLTKFQSRELENISFWKAFALQFPGNFGTFPGKKSTSTQELFYIFW